MPVIAARKRPLFDERARFVLAFFAFAALGLGLYCFPYGQFGIKETFFDAFLTGYARLAGAVIAVFDPSAVATGTEIHGRYAVRIVKGCDAMEAKILFVSAVLAFPTGLWRRLLAAGAGLVALTTLNVLRIASLYYAGMAFPKLVDVLHLEVWPLALVVFAALLFLWFAALATERAEAP